VRALERLFDGKGKVVFFVSSKAVNLEDLVENKSHIQMVIDAQASGA
jgi:hypothetical protein